MKFTHVINPVLSKKGSELFIAQEVTFESLQRAIRFTNNAHEVTVVSAQFAEDRVSIPSFVQVTSDLSRSVLDLGHFKKQRKLPLIADILEKAYSYQEADYLIYTNIDIAVMPYFYLEVAKLIEKGQVSFGICRRTLPDIRLPLVELYSQLGKPHPGIDCFVFPRAFFPKFILGNVCIGAPKIARALEANLKAQDSDFTFFKDLHLTFHLGDKRTWDRRVYRDYQLHNETEMQRIDGFLNGLLPDARRE